MGRTACTEPQCLYKGDLHLYLITALNFKNPNHLDTAFKQNILYKVKYSIKHWKIFFLDGIQIYIKV